MEIIPAIDLIDGKCVRLEKGDFSKKKVYAEDPLKVALAFQKAGIKKVHVVDLEGAKEGKAKNWETIRKIARHTQLILQVGGGLRSKRDLQKLFRLGSYRAVLGTVVLKRPARFKRLLKTFGAEKIIVDVPFQKKRVYSKGWQEQTSLTPVSLLLRLQKLGVRTVICTDMSRDGMLKGPNVSLYRKLQKKFPRLAIIASGGARNKSDLTALKNAKVRGTIVGKAIYEKKISLKDLTSF